MLEAQVTLPLPANILNVVLPNADPDGTINAEANAAMGRPIASPTQWTERRQRAQDQIRQAGNGGAPRVGLARQRERTWTAFTAMHEPPHTGDLRRLQAQAARHEWRETHRPADEAEFARLSGTDQVSRTNAPIVRCDNTTEHDKGAPLRFLRARYAGQMRQDSLARRARYLYNRAYTAAARLRFPTNEAAAAADATCTDPYCSDPARRTAETVEHVLLHCPRYQAARSRLDDQLADHNLSPTLDNILNPPDRGGSRHYLTLYRLTDAFLASIDTTRQQLSLPSLNGCPHQPSRPHARRSPLITVPAVDRRAAPPTAPAAALPLDTG
jgi:hypothetical protein